MEWWQWQGSEMKETIKFLVMDVDGTLADGKIYMSPTGEAMKAFNIKDGCGILLAERSNYDYNKFRFLGQRKSTLLTT